MGNLPWLLLLLGVQGHFAQDDLSLSLWKMSVFRHTYGLSSGHHLLWFKKRIDTERPCFGALWGSPEEPAHSEKGTAPVCGVISETLNVHGQQIARAAWLAKIGPNCHSIKYIHDWGTKHKTIMNVTQGIYRFSRGSVYVDQVSLGKQEENGLNSLRQQWE